VALGVNANWLDTRSGFFILIALGMVVGALYMADHYNATNEQEYKLACIEAGGSVVENNCIYPKK